MQVERRTATITKLFSPFPIEIHLWHPLAQASTRQKYKLSFSCRLMHQHHQLNKALLVVFTYKHNHATLVVYNTNLMEMANGRKMKLHIKYRIWMNECIGLQKSSNNMPYDDYHYESDSLTVSPASINLPQMQNYIMLVSEYQPIW